MVNARTGTVVINGAVRIAPVAITHGKMTVIQVDEKPQIIQPNALLAEGGQTAGFSRTARYFHVEQEPVARCSPAVPAGRLAVPISSGRSTRSGASAGHDLVAILEALKQAGALKAEMVVI